MSHYLTWTLLIKSWICLAVSCPFRFHYSIAKCKNLDFERWVKRFTTIDPIETILWRLNLLKSLKHHTNTYTGISSLAIENNRDRDGGLRLWHVRVTPTIRISNTGPVGKHTVYTWWFVLNIVAITVVTYEGERVFVSPQWCHPGSTLYFCETLSSTALLFDTERLAISVRNPSLALNSNQFGSFTFFLSVECGLFWATFAY